MRIGIVLVVIVAVVLMSQTAESAEKKKDLYSILKVSRTASVDEIKKAFRTLSRKYHPE